MAKAIRSAVVAAAVENNFDPLVALKPVLFASPPHRRGETRKKLVELFFAGDVEGLLAAARKMACKPHSSHHLRPRSRPLHIPHPAALAALAAGRPGRALRRLACGELLDATSDAVAKMRLACEPTPQLLPPRPPYPPFFEA
jgi:hypothetical protein